MTGLSPKKTPAQISAKRLRTLLHRAHWVLDFIARPSFQSRSPVGDVVPHKPRYDCPDSLNVTDETDVVTSHERVC